MLYEATQNQNQKEQACYARFFNGALGLDTADIFINGELVAQDLRHGTFSAFRKAKPGAYKLEIKLGGEGSDVEFTELISLMEDMAYTIALTGDAQHLSLAVLPLDLRQDLRLPNIRFANVMPPYQAVLDIDINGHRAVAGLMFKEISENIELMPQNHYITVYDADSQRILEDGFAVEAGKNYLGVIAGSMGEPENPPALFVTTDMPIL
jgi:hypothetical protein